MSAAEYVLTLSCPDRVGIVAAVSSALAKHDCSINDSQQYADQDTGQFFMRVRFAVANSIGLDGMKTRLAEPLAGFEMNWNVHDVAKPLRVVIMVSKQGHVLNHVLFQQREGLLPIEVVAVVSNHETWRKEVEWHGIAFHHVPVSSETKPDSERYVLDLMEETGAEALILARYMQILSDDMCRALEGRAINIHHSLLPSFKGARPYEQAHDRGVKVIGATAHFVTAELDEGPIIEQDLRRVDHRFSATQLAALGQDLEARALASAVKAHAENRVFLNGIKTVVFD
ncbi:MAG: formyltetrahydrofolate deformylase [Aeromicrobium sp.]|nr:MAG: formyltetrahydrofolate deformylase [Aeromicrobium sp.]